MRTIPLIIALIAGTGCAGAAGESNPPVAPVTPTPPEAKAPVVAGDGFYMDVPKWSAPGTGKATGLRAEYKWGGGETRETAASDGGSYWRLTFPDKPKPSDLARVDLRYEFELTDADHTKVKNTTSEVIAKAIEAVKKAALRVQTGTSLQDAVAAESTLIIAAAKPLDDFTDANGAAGSAIVLRALGFTQRADGSWEAKPESLAPLIRLANESVSANVPARSDEADAAYQDLSKLAPRSEEQACSTAVAAAKADATKAADAVGACASAIKAALEARIKALQAMATAPPDAATQEAKLAARVEYAETLVATATTSATDHKAGKAYAELGRDDLVANSYAYKGVNFARATMKRAAALTVNDTEVHKLTDELGTRVLTLHSDRPGSVVLAESGEKRIYDISTGVVYLGGLDDVVVPILISVCPVPGGCLHKGEAFFDSPVATARGLSVDLGVRAQTLDRADPRDDGSLAFFTGGSWNPLFFIRLSGGAYEFENKQTNHWNAAWYAGATVNILQSAELLGVVGLGTPTAPKIVGK